MKFFFLPGTLCRVDACVDLIHQATDISCYKEQAGLFPTEIYLCFGACINHRDLLVDSMPGWLYARATFI